MDSMLSGFERHLCDIQGRLFVLSLAKGLNSGDFIKKFMNSETCQFFDLPYDRLQWAGEEYILENLLDETNIESGGTQFSKESLYWIGYVYRYWHLLKGESSKSIWERADAELMGECYCGFHTLDVEMAIENLKEIHGLKMSQNT